MDARGNANPMTFMGTDGKQYLVISATNSLVAYRLP
jgi:glucose dehydrogenase